MKLARLTIGIVPNMVGVVIFEHSVINSTMRLTSWVPNTAGSVAPSPINICCPYIVTPELSSFS